VTALQIMDDWDESDRAKVNPIAGQAGIAANSGAADALTPRVILATDDPAVALLTTLLAAVAADGAASPANAIQVGGQVFSTVPTEMSNGDIVAAWLDTFRRPIIAGYNLSESALDTIINNPAALVTLEVVNLNAVATDTEGTSVGTSNFGKKTIFFKSTVGAEAGAEVTVNVELSPTGVAGTWSVYDSCTATHDTNDTFYDIFVIDFHVPYMRLTVTDSSGTVTVTGTICGRGY